MHEADVIVTATTSREPIVERGWFAPGAHINAVGSSIPTTRELDGAKVGAGRLFVDARESTLNESGDLLLAVREGTVAADVPLVEIGDVLSGKTAGRTSPHELTVFISHGLAVEDLAAAELAACRRRGWAGRGGATVIPLDSITRARETLRGVAVRTPLVRLRLADVPAEIHLKLECLQPIGSFKIRGAINAMAEAPPEALARGVVTASAGNMAQGVAWGARERGVPCTVVVPDTAPQTKLEAIERLGGRIVPVPFEDWWRAIETSQHPGAEGYSCTRCWTTA